MCRLYRFSLRPIAILNCLLLLVSALPLTSPQNLEDVSSSDNTRCNFVGNPDIYGPGIRIGIYAQTLALFLSRYFIISQSFAIRDSLVVFTLALLIVAIMLAASTPLSPADAIEFFLVLQILSWECATGMRARSTYVLEALRNRDRRVLSMDAMNIAPICLHVWFWFIGLDSIAHNEQECQVKVFFFVETELQGWFRIYMKSMTVWTLLESVYTSFFRFAKAWGTGLWRGCEKEMREAVEGFEEWKKSKAGNELTDIACVTRSLDFDPDIASCHSSRLFEDAIKSTHTVSVPPSHTGNPTTQNNEKMDTNEACADPRLQLGNSRETCSTSVAASVNIIPTRTPRRAFKSNIFEDTYAAEAFIQNCVSASSHSQFHKKYPRLYKTFQRLLVPRPRSYDHTNNNQPQITTPRYIDCLRLIVKSILTFTFPRRAFVVYSHIVALRCLDPMNAPYQIHAALIQEPSADVALPPPRTIALASRTLIAHLPSPTARHKYGQAIVDLSIHIFVIVQIELTIRWNGITGLGGVGNVGQLIPLLVGVGGLAFLVARGIEGVCKGVKIWEDDGGGKDIGSVEWERFVSAFEEWKASVENGDRQADESAQRTGTLASDV
jgi:hypothetical protein